MTPEEPLPADEKPLTVAEQQRRDRITLVEALLQKRWKQKEIARHLHIHPKTIHRYRNYPLLRMERTRKRCLQAANKPYIHATAVE